MTITYVSAFLKIDTVCEDLDKNTFEWRLNHFKDIASTGINLCIFISPEFEEIIREFCIEYTNVYIVHVLSIEDTWIYKTLKSSEVDYTLPVNRNEKKDTESYLILQNSKIEFLQETLVKNPWNSTHFAWIDFSISYIFNQKESTLRYLKKLSNMTLSNNNVFIIPGCWSKNGGYVINMNYVCWRFCGGFFIADKNSMENFCIEFKKTWLDVLIKYKIISWEVNVFSYLELISTTWRPIWYKGDHTDYMIKNISCDFITYVLINHPLSQPKIIQYNYPVINNYLPGSASYLEYNGKCWLNTRYVNYINYKSHYIFPDGSNRIRNINMISELVVDEETKNLYPLKYSEMDMNSAELYEHISDTFSYGLEDIRLYEHEGRSRFIATTVNYAPVGSNRMVVGDFCFDTATYSNCKIVNSPYENVKCEKNWSFIYSNEKKERFVYQWHPFEVGYLQPGNDDKYLDFIIDCSYQINNPFITKLKGSTNFVQIDGGYIGLVHYSEDRDTIRYYYHNIILLDVSYKPVKISLPFVFCKYSIEYCIGMCIDTDTYTFWISQMDRDPITITVSKDAIPINIDVDYE